MCILHYIFKVTLRDYSSFLLSALYASRSNSTVSTKSTMSKVNTTILVLGLRSICTKATMVVMSIKPMGYIMNAALFLRARITQTPKAIRPIAATNWLEAPKMGQIRVQAGTLPAL